MFNVLKSMFNGLVWNIRYNSFLQLYSEDNFHQYYKELDFFERVKTLVKHIPEKKYGSYYNANIYIPTYYNNFISWFKACQELRSKIKYDDTRVAPVLVETELKLSDFLETDDNRAIEYGSAISVALNELDLLYDCLRGLDEISRGFFLRQYREVYITGLFFLYTLILERGNYSK